MSDLKSRCVIPTNSLYLIYNEMGDLLNDQLVYLRATSSQVKKTELRKPHKFLKIYDEFVTRRSVMYRYAKSREPFDIASFMEALDDEGIADIWVHEMHLRLKHSLGLFDFIFKNAPLTEGSEASRFVANYIKDLIQTGWIKSKRLRHLPLVGTRSNPPGESLALEEISSPEFIKWISQKTGGLIRMKLIQRKDSEGWIDYSIKDVL